MEAEGVQGLGVHRNDLDVPVSQVIATCGLTRRRLNARPNLAFQSSQWTSVSRPRLARGIGEKGGHPHLVDVPHKNPSSEKERHAQSDS